MGICNQCDIHPINLKYHPYCGYCRDVLIEELEVKYIDILNKNNLEKNINRRLRRCQNCKSHPINVRYYPFCGICKYSYIEYLQNEIEYLNHLFSFKQNFSTKYSPKIKEPKKFKRKNFDRKFLIDGVLV